jgi:hypothetical protein
MQEEVDLGSDSDSEPEILEEAGGACEWPRAAPGPDLSIIDDAATVDNTAHNTTNMAHLIAADPKLIADDGNIMAPRSPEVSVMMTSHDVDVSNHVLASSNIIMADPDLIMDDPDLMAEEEPEVAVTGIFQKRRIRSESRSNSSGRVGPLISKNKVLRIHEILARIRIRESIPLTNGSGSCYFRQ